MLLRALLCAALAVLVSAVTKDEVAHDRVVCYLGSWANYRPSKGNFKIEDIDPRLCTHLIYTFVGIGYNGEVRILDAWLDLDLGAYKRFNDLKLINPAVKTIIAIGGWNEGSVTFSAVASSPEKRAKFIDNVVEFITIHEFDGFDLDWEYPADRGGNVEVDKANFAILAKEMRERFDQMDRKVLLTSAVKATQQGIDTSYDVPFISKYFDFINVMAYDLRGSWEKKTGHHTGLYKHKNDTTDDDLQLNVAACIDAWIKSGAPPEKLVLGMGTYGRTFTLANVNENGIGAPAVGPGHGGQYTREPGMLGYNEICELQQTDPSWEVFWEEDQLVPYTVKGNQWVGYETPESIVIKVQFAQSLKLGGVMIWSVETDDFRGICGPKYPILNAINDALGKPVPTTTSTSTTSTTTTTSRPPKPPLPGEEVCQQPGIVGHPTDCTKFCLCVANGDEYIYFVYDCPPGLVFDDHKLVCNYPQVTHCERPEA